jgi:hypothetical protein
MNTIFFSFRNLLVVTSLSPLMLTASASTSSNALPIQSSGAVSSVRACERGNRFLVTGSVRPTFSSVGNHLDVQLIEANGRVIAENVETIKLGHPRASRSRHGADTFVTSFPLTAARQASRVKVNLHTSSH